jgi:HEAT repeat protein
LTDDEDVVVRAAAASALALLVKDGTGGALAVTALQRAAREPGVLVPKEIARVLGPSKDLPDSAAAVLTELQSHPSWRVRSLAEGEASE